MITIKTVVRLAGWAIAMTLAATDGFAQEIIYVRPPATVGGKPATDAQKVEPGARVETGSGGVIVVELRNWPATKDGPCTLFLIASGGRGTTIPRRESAQPQPCGRGPGTSLDSALQGTAVSASVLLFPDGKSDALPPGFTEGAVYDRLSAAGGRRGRGRSGAQSSTPGRGARGRAGAGAAGATVGPQLTIESATYGANCGAAAGNMTALLAEACNGRTRCEYVIDYQVIGDPVPGCGKDYRVTYTCAPGGLSQTQSVDAEAGFKRTLRIGCQ